MIFWMASVGLILFLAALMAFTLFGPSDSDPGCLRECCRRDHG